MTAREDVKSLRDIEEIIARAIKKVGGNKENDICRYIPGPTGGYMHHFTLRKMKQKQPQELGTLIERFIIQTANPSAVAPKQRAARGMRKGRDQIRFTRTQLERLLEMAKAQNDREIVSLLSPKRSLASCKRELILAIKQDRVEPELWNAYVESMRAYLHSHEINSASR